MNIKSISAEDFEAVWSRSDEFRYGYLLNRGLLTLYGVLMAAFWGYWGISVSQGGLDVPLTVIAVVFGCVTVFLGFNILYWRYFGRLSGVICEEDRLLWRHGNQIFSVSWTEVDFETLGLLDVDLSTPKYEHFLTVGTEKLYLFRPHVRIRELETCLGTILSKLKAHGCIPDKKKRTKKKDRKSA